jgi:hypothetical protein
LPNRESLLRIADCGFRISFPEDIRLNNTNCREQNRKNRRKAMLAEASSPWEGTN